MTLFVALLSESHAAGLALVWAVVDVHAGVIHDVAKLGELCGTHRALQYLVHPASLTVELVGLIEHISNGRIFLGIFGLSVHFVFDELDKLITNARVYNSCVARSSHFNRLLFSHRQ